MSGHSKWATTKRKKAVIDAKRGKMFTKLIKEITIAAREGGGDPAGNPRLRLAVDNAKSANMPQDNIDRAIKKATGELEGVSYQEFTYEGYAPAGIVIWVNLQTVIKTRMVAKEGRVFGKAAGHWGEVGPVAGLLEGMGVSP